ncbi:IS3 family transposase [Salmonella enterica subsp. enterica]|uniref:IS3 family transposase n=3 Tax=Salmonella enterica TaxID=28901 RepID=A0A8E9ZGJ3_SALER|nr:IS3 family transposase [Salmonella enterica]EGO1520852.1 IS3 family transposase [Salmonella enterica subsp. diarizonae serovar 60:r:e,n,x,z15]ESJ14032.1 transposase [Salmonella enterica subsp. diarizonae serovar 60:r:e,n,x,z15 str. 01-0170]QXR78587.1 IS3 family transposase [Salmonella enterica subsp. enterica]EGP8144379.1 IS3 family transposase [Salmonella enterica]
MGQGQKAECIHGLRFTSWDMMRATVFSYLEGDNNRWRRHSACSDPSPEQFKKRTSLRTVSI